MTRFVGTIFTPSVLLLSLGACASPEAEQSATPVNRSVACSIVLAAPGTFDGSAESDLDQRIRSRIERVRRSAVPTAELDRLGWLFVAKARRSHDETFFRLATDTAACMRDLSGLDDDASALLLEGHALYSLHRFAEAEQIARRLVEMRTFPFDWGLLGDALLSLGRLDEAAEAYRQMNELRPGLQSYSRAAQIRWMTGDLSGARELMTMAARAGSTRDQETLAWTLAELGRFELLSGDLSAARAAADQALAAFPDHAPSLLLLGRVDLAEHRPQRAVGRLRDAVRVDASAQNLWTLADALIAAGDATAAAEVEARLLERGPTEDPRTTSLFLATRQRRPALALSLAQREIDVRTDPHTHDALAWALVAVGDVEAAAGHLEYSLAHGTIDPRLFLHAGLIASAQGRTDDARRWLASAEQHRAALLPSEQIWLDGKEIT